MKEYLSIILVIIVLFSVVIVDTMADSELIAFNRAGYQEVRPDPGSVETSLKKSSASITATNENQSSSIPALLSMLMIGLTLVGLASFREDNNEKKSHTEKQGGE